MENNSDVNEALRAIKDVGSNNESWFRDTPHRWPQASLPLAYAVACVEVVSKKSEKAGEIYSQIVEAWGKPGIKAVYEEIMSEVPDSETEKVKQAFLHPETEFLPDPNKPFRNLEEMFTSSEIDDAFFEDNDNKRQLSPEGQQGLDDAVKLVSLVSEFILVGFNRESDIDKGRYRVILSERAPWLIWAVIMRTSFENYNITLERLRYIYKLRKYKGKIIDFHKVLTEQPMSRWHRRMIASGKAAKLKLKNDRVIVEAARHWYQCRVAYPSINKFCYAQSQHEIFLDPKNLHKQISPCDKAVGYQGRLPRKDTN